MVSEKFKENLKKYPCRLGILESWEAERLEQIKGAVENITKEGTAIACDRLKALMIVNFVENHFLQQQIRESTIKEDILDLIFTSDESLFLAPK